MTDDENERRLKQAIGSVHFFRVLASMRASAQFVRFNGPDCALFHLFDRRVVMKTQRWMKALLSIGMLFTVFGTVPPLAVNAQEQSDDWDGTADTSWYVEGESAFTIDSAEEFSVNCGNW